MPITPTPPPVHTVRITGMTCAACEHHVTRALGRLPGVGSVSASAPRGRALLTGELPPEPALRAALAAAGYELGAPRWLTRDRRAWTTALAGSAVAVVAGVLAARTGLTGWTPASSLGGPLLALLVGLAAGVSTCMALVGGLVLGVSAAASRRAAGAAGAAGPSRGVVPPAVRAQLAFTGGRWAGFAAGGALLGTVGSSALLPDPVLSAGMFVAAAVMVVLGIRLTGLSPRISGWALTLPGGRGTRAALGGDRGAALAGASTFLLPCGFTQAMQLYAITQGSWASGGLVMAAFAVGTTPGLLGLGLLGGLNARRRPTGPAPTPARAGAGTRLIGVAVLAFALVTATGGMRALGVTLPGTSGPARAVPTAVSGNVTLDGATQVVTLTQTSHGYVPADSVVWAGVPIRWRITSTSGYTCSSLLRVPALGVHADLNPAGLHVIDLPALGPGTTRFACAMGMYTGTLRAIARPSAP